MAPPILEVKNLSKKFAGSEGYTLKDINLSIKAGDIFGIVGSSGAGKSTFMRCLVGLEKPTSGSIHVEDIEITRLSESHLIPFRKRFGMVFQQFNLFPSRTVAQNIAFPMEIHGVNKQSQRQRIDELLDLVGLASKQHAYPATLSGGEKQRVGIARALANNPHILFCDEATSALDSTSTRSILNLLLTLNQKLNLTIVVITHELDTVKAICNQMAVLSCGEIVEQGTVLDVFAKPTSLAARQLLHPLIEKLPQNFITDLATDSILVNLTFRGDQAKQPIISRLIKEHQVEVNILLGSIEAFQSHLLGSLIIELTGNEAEMKKALSFLQASAVDYEVVT